MARREIKLPYTEKHMVCPHCRADLIFGTDMDAIIRPLESVLSVAKKS